MFGLAWHLLEAGAGFYLGESLDSPALRGFALDSGVEILAGVFLLVRLFGHPVSERLTSRLIGVSFFLISLWIVFDSVLSFVSPPPAPSGAAAAWSVVLAILVILTMYPLAFWKARVAREMHSDAVRFEGRQTMLCGHMAWLLLLGVLGPMVGIAFLSGVAALLIACLAALEGVRALRGQECSCSFHAQGVDYNSLRPLSRLWLQELSPLGRQLFALRWPLTAAFLLLAILCSSGGLWLLVWGVALLGIASLWMPLWVIRSRIERDLSLALPA